MPHQFGRFFCVVKLIFVWSNSSTLTISQSRTSVIFSAASMRQVSRACRTIGGNDKASNPHRTTEHICTMSLYDELDDVDFEDSPLSPNTPEAEAKTETNSDADATPVSDREFDSDVDVIVVDKDGDDGTSTEKKK